MDTADPIDAEAIRKLRELGDEAFLIEMIDAFLVLAYRSSAEARAALTAGNLDPVIRMGHSLKSSARIMGAYAVQDVASRIERCALAKRLADMPDLLDEFDRSFADAKMSLDVIKTGMPHL